MGSYRLDPALLKLHPTAFVARGAALMGDVHLGEEASVWFGAVVRGDTESIRIGARANIQDNAVIHADPGFPTEIGEGVTVGHRCIVHGATIGAGSLLGMGAIVMNGAVIGERCLVGAGALITSGKQIPPGMLVLGSPARPLRALRPEELDEIAGASRHYVDASRAFMAAGWHHLMCAEG